MGLRDKAAKLSKQPPSPEQYEAGPDSFQETDVRFEEALKKKGSASIEDILSKPYESGLEKNLSKFLLPEDLLHSTSPANLEYSLQSRLESLINLIEICKELASLETEDELWESIAYSVLGQVGAKEAAIFLKQQNRLQLQVSKGYIIPEDMVFSKRSGLERTLKKDMAIHYGKPVIENLVGDEKKWIMALNPALIIPVVRYEELLGFILLGPPVGMPDYHLDDLLYLKLLGEILGSFYDSILRIQRLNAKEQIWETREKLHQEYLFYQNKLLECKTRHDASELTLNFLDRTFESHGYLLCARNEDGFGVEFHKGLSQKTVKNLQFDFHEAWIVELTRAGNRIYWDDFREKEQVAEKFSPEERKLIQSATLLPIRFRGELFGLFFIFDIQEKLSGEDLFYTRNMIYTYFWFLIGQKHYAEDFLDNHVLLKDPLQLVKKLLSEKEEILKKKKKPYSVYVLQIANWNRVKKLLSKRKAEKWKARFSKALQSEIRKPFYFSELITGQFFVILENTPKSDLWLINRAVHRTLKDEFGETTKDSVAPLTKSRIYSRPEDPPKTLDELLFIG